MVDLHCHILPGVDDGPHTFEESLAMARLAVADGVTHIVATPHLAVGTPHDLSPDRIRQITGRLNELLQAEGLPLKVLPGAEVRAAPSLVAEAEAGQLMTVADRGRYLLVELPPATYPVFAEEVFFRLQLAGLTPIIAHAERVHSFRSQPRLLDDFVARGYPIQINASSLAGREGRRRQAYATKLVRTGAATVIASDGHNTHRRKPLLSIAARRVRQESLLHDLTTNNPRRLIEK